MGSHVNRREFMQGLGAAAAAAWIGVPQALLAKTPATAPVAVGRCQDYNPQQVRATLATLFDQIGGVDRVVRGKSVVIKLNMTGKATDHLRGMPLGMTHWVNPVVIGSTISLLGQGGARRITLVESTLSPENSLQDFMRQAGWNPAEFSSAARGVEFEDTNYAGPSGKYKRLWVPSGGMLFRAYDVNSSYADCDVYVSLAKLKEHATAGVTLSMKNSFGVTPCTIYGGGAGIDAPGKVVKGSRYFLHDGSRQPSETSLAEINPASPRSPGYRVPRVTADMAGARPIDIAIIDGISTVAGGEGPWIKRCRPVHAGLLIAGTNCVTTDAVSAALMGFDPMADRGTAPFEHCDSTLKLAESVGIGTRDLRRIEVIGTPISKARIDFRAA